MNALAVIEREPSRNVEIWRASTDAASLCKDIVVKRAINLQGKRYVPVEGWQAIALAHGCVASAENVRRVDGGYAADGVIRRMADGSEIARAEGFVGEDEPVWFGGKTPSGKVLPRRPDFAIRAMAQTRGISRACRSAFAHVVVMMDVGLETTPYEEMAGVYAFNDAAPPRPTPPVPQAKRARDLTPEPREQEQPALEMAQPDEARAKAEFWANGYVESLRAADTIEAVETIRSLKANRSALAKLQREHPDLYVRVIEADPASARARDGGRMSFTTRGSPAGQQPAGCE